jgi:hypothetical protein
MDSINGISSDSPAQNEENNLGTLQNVDLPVLLSLLVQNSTISTAEQQVVLQELTKPRQCHAILQVICGKGMQSMESFLKIVALLQQQQQYPPNGGSLGYVSGEITTSSSSSSDTGEFLLIFLVW